MTIDPTLTRCTDPRLDWYLEARFGLFLHWGAYSAAGVEASWPIMTPDLAEVMFKNPRRISEAEYTRLPQRFDPQDFDARAWVQAAKDAGMRYIVITSKHHDGFCMFDAPGTDYKITRTPYDKDICLQLAEACAAAGMRLGFYYSPPDMHHPGYRDTNQPVTANWLGQPRRPEWASYLDYMESHIRKLLTDYGPVSILWFDALVNHRKYDPPRFHRLIHELSPETLINDRLGGGYDFITPEQFIPTQGVPVRTGKPPAAEAGGDGLFKAAAALINAPLVGSWLRKQLDRYAEGQLALTQIPQQPYPTPELFQPWETCMTMGSSWGYNTQEARWKSPQALLRQLVQIASKGGNLLLNIGPTPQGTFPPECVERLGYIGRWMDHNAQAVHGTTYAPPVTWPGGRITRRGSRFYLHILEWPSDGRLAIPDFPAAASRVQRFDGQNIPFTQSGTLLEINLDPVTPDQDITVVSVETEQS